MTFDALPAATSFPGVPLDVRVELNLSGTWTDITSKYVYQRDQVLIGRGHPDESTTTTASTLALTLNNRDGRFSSLNPAGPYYGSLGRNTPIRVSFPEGASYLRLENDGTSPASSYASCPDSASFPSGAVDTDIQLDVTLDNWNAGQILAGKWAETGNQRTWLLLLNDTGNLTFVLSPDGTATKSYVSDATVPLPPLLRLCVRVTMNHTTGDVTFYTAPRGNLASASWTQLGDVQNQGASTSLFDSTAAVQLGWCTDAAGQTGGTPGVLGKIHAFRWLLNIAGTEKAGPDFTAATAGAASFTDAESNTWTLAGTSEISNRKYRFHGEVAAWPQAWNTAGTDVYIQISASGLLRHLGRNTQPLNSALYRANVRFTGSLAPVAYWPGEDLAGSTQIASALGGPAMTISSGQALQLASFSSFACSAPIPVLAGATFSGQVPAYTPGPDNVLRFLMAVPSGGDTNGGILARVATTGTVRYMTLTYGSGFSGTLTLTGFDSGGAQLFTTGAVGFAVNGQLLYCAISLQQSGSNITYMVQTLAPGAANALSGSGTLTAATTGNVTGVLVNPKGLLTGTAAGQWTVQSTWDGLFDMAGPLQSWQGETAGNRFSRLCTEEGVAFRGRGRLADTVPMGAQTQQTLTALLQECADADRGQWTEPRQCLSWGYRTRNTLGNQTAAVTLNYPSGTVSGLTPTEDDQTTQNDITVTNTDGSSSRQVLTTGPLAATPPILGGIGRYPAAAQVNLASDTQLDSEAGWLLHLGTVNESRYPAISVNMARAQLASVYYDLQDMDAGDRLVITNPPAWLPPGQVDQLVQGITEAGTYRTFTETFAGVPSSPWNVAYADDVVYGRADTDGSAVCQPATTGGTSLQVTGFPWTTAGGDFPFDIQAAGERMTATACGAGPATGLIGVYMPQGVAGGFINSDFTTQNTIWTAIAGAGFPITATRIYAQTNYTVTTAMTQAAAAGVLLVIDFLPPAVPSPSDRASLVSMMAALQAISAKCIITLWHEPFNSGLTAAQFQTVTAYYGPAVRAAYPLWVNFSGSDTVVANGYYPPSALYDGIAADLYVSAGFGPPNGLTRVADQADAMVPPKPVGLFEFNGSADTNGQTQGNVTSFFTFVQGFFAARNAAGKISGPAILFQPPNPSFNWMGAYPASNASFETSLGTWVSQTNCGIAQNAVQAKSGTHSQQMTPAAAGTIQSVHVPFASVLTAGAGMPVSPGDTVYLSAWFKASTTGHPSQPLAVWFNSAGTLLSQSGPGTVTTNTTSFTQVSGSVTAPANAAWAIGMAQVQSTTGVTDIHWVDDFDMHKMAASANDLASSVSFPWDYRVGLWQSMWTALNGTSGPQQFTVTRSVNGVVKAHAIGEDVRLYTPPIVSL